MLVPIVVLSGVGWLVWRGISWHPSGGGTVVGGAELVSPLDTHLSPDTDRAVEIAILKETEPTNLRRFSVALLPDFPGAASALAAQAALLEQPSDDAAGGFNLLPKFVRKEIQSLGKDAGKAAVFTSLVPGVGLPTALAVAVAGHPAGKIVNATVGRIPIVRDVAHVTDKLSKSVPFQLAQKAFVTVHPAMFATMLMAGAGNEALDGQKLDKVLNSVRLQGGAWLKQEGALASLVPVIGQVLSPALTTAGALALGEPIPDAAIDIAASVVPGGPVAQAAVKTGGTFAVDLSKHQSFSKAAFGAARAAAMQAAAAAGVPSQIVGTAFDLGMGIAQGKNLQRAGFGVASSLLKAEGGTLAEKALDAMNLSGTGDLVQGALGKLQQALPPGAADAAKQAAGTLVKNPAVKTSVQLAQAAHVPEPVARAVLAATTRAAVGAGGHAAPVVHSNVLHAIVGPPSPPVAGMPGRADRLAWVRRYLALDASPAAAAGYW